MKKSSSIAFIKVGILATIVSFATMAPPAVAQVNTPRTDTQEPRTTTTSERNDDNSGLWGLAGLAGLLGFLGRRKEEDRSNMPAYRDPNVR